MCNCRMGRRRKRRVGAKSSDLMNLAQTMLLTTAGHTAARFVGQVDFLEKNPYLKLGAKALITWYLLGQKDATMQSIGTGVAVSATQDIVKTFVPEFADKLGIGKIEGRLMNHSLLSTGVNGRFDGNMGSAIGTSSGAKPKQAH